METSLKTDFAQIFSHCPKNLSYPKFGGAAAPLAPPVRTPMYLKNTHKNPKFGKVRQVPTREFPTKFPDWDLSHSSKFEIFGGIL